MNISDKMLDEVIQLYVEWKISFEELKNYCLENDFNMKEDFDLDKVYMARLAYKYHELKK